MKKTILLIAVTLFIFNETHAQFSLGASGGVNLANVKFDKNEGFGEVVTESATYYFFGIIPKYNFNSKLSVSTDVQYSLKGYKFKEEITSTSWEYRYGYLDFLPKVEYSILKNLALGLGCNIGFKLDEKVKLENGDWVTPIINIISSTDFGLVGSVRGTFKNFFIIVSYNYGLVDIDSINYTDANGNPIGDIKQFNRNLQIGLGYFFEFKKKE
jgi:Outer membrane protein beta-barrel domain